MTFTRSLLLGCAILIGAAGLAQAADLPIRKAAPVDYVRVCDFTGSGFFYIPGTDTCLELGAYVRIEGDFISGSRALTPVPGAPGRAPGVASIINPGRDRDDTGFLSRTRLFVDTRTETAYGTLRTYIQYQVDRVQGLYSEGGLSGGANTLTNSGGNNAALRRGFIQFAGITAGRVQSFFDFYADNYNYEGIANSDIQQNVFAYTYNAAGGLSATLSVEDRNARNLSQGVGSILGGANAVNSAVRYGGETIPDIVGVLRADQGWGSAQLSAAYHEIQTTQGPFAGTSGQGFSGQDANGFAVQGGVRLKLPMLAAGDDLWVEGAYQQGAYLYQDSGYFLNQGFTSSALGGFQHIDRDAIAIHTPGTAASAYSLQMGEGFSVMAAFNHYFTANFHDVLFGSYEQTSYGKAKTIDWTEGGLGDGSEYRIGNQFLWDPVKNLEFGLEFDYMHIDQTLAHNPGVAATALPAGVEKDPTNYEVRLRAERDF
ncbi:MAG: porin [Janthinobacterium lividum]